MLTLDKPLPFPSPEPNSSTRGVSIQSFRTPSDLAVTDTSFKNVLLVGQCILNAWAYELEHRQKGLSIEHILFNFTTQLPDQPALPLCQYDFQIVAIPLRGILHESKFLRLSYLDTASVEKLFHEACDQMSLFLQMAMKWNISHSLLSFVTNFLVPQQNPNGRLMPRYDLRNICYFVERLNEHLSQEVAKYSNAYVLDIDQVSASIGRRYIQDDSVCTISHGSTLANFADDKDQNRIEPPRLPITKYYNAKIGDFIEEVWREAKAMYLTIRQVDPVKMVIVDLDDTLWRGILAEQESVTLEVIEGWPLGVIDALAFLRKRGVILAIASKNEEVNVERVFEQLLRHRLPLSSFALKRINWLPKTQNISEMLAEANLLPRNVLFIDDNPVERASVSAAFPDLRTIGADPYSIRRILLWAPETQVPHVTDESARRSEMIKAQVVRENARKTLSREDFLKTLDLEVSFSTVVAASDLNFPRALELLNKTNQFNTTGKRWSGEEIGLALQDGLKIICFHVSDRFTEYGLVGVVLLKDCSIIQYVMSCRVLGLDVEKAALAFVSRLVIQASGKRLEALLIETAANFPCRNLYRDSGFVWDRHMWSIPVVDTGLTVPPHVRVVTSKAQPPPAVVPMRITGGALPSDPVGRAALPYAGNEDDFPSRALHEGETYYFNNDADLSWLGPAQGIGRHEKWGAWTVEDKAVLLFVLPRNPISTTKLKLKLRPFLHNARQRQSIMVSVNGNMISTTFFEGSSAQDYDLNLSIPFNYVLSGGKVALMIGVDAPRSPRDLGISEDPRKLGVGLISLAVSSSPPAP
jgi:FkbH-like protein